jgi:hypothetical protein
MERDSPRKCQDLSTAQDGSLSPPSRADSVSNTGLPLMPRCQSSGNLTSASKDAYTGTRSSVHHLTTQLEGMEQSRAHESIVSAELEAGKQHWQQLRKAYRKSRIQYENVIDPFSTQPDAASTTQTIAALRERFINDRSLLESYAADVRRIRRKLQTAQSSRGNSEMLVMQSAQQWIRAPFSNALAESPVPLTSAKMLPRLVKPSTVSPSEVDLLLERYHSRLATVESLGERLADHDYEYWNEVARRELLRDRDEALGSTDDEFEEASEQEKKDILQELSRAMEEATQLKAECASAGADARSLESGGLTFPYSSDFAKIGYQDSLQAILDRVPTEAFKDVEIVRGELSENGSDHSEPGRANQLVASWREHVPLPQDTPIF